MPPDFYSKLLWQKIVITGPIEFAESVSYDDLFCVAVFKEICG